MELDRVFLLFMWAVSMVPLVWIALTENGSSRGWLSRLFAGQDFVLLGTVIFLGNIEQLEGTIRLVFMGVFVFKFIKGLELVQKRAEFARHDPFYDDPTEHIKTTGDLK